MNRPFTLALDAKRAFSNATGLGVYTRGLIYNLGMYYPDIAMLLYAPKMPSPKSASGIKNFYNWLLEHQNKHIEKSSLPGIFTPQGMWNMAPSLWRSWGLTKSLHSKDIRIFHGPSNELPFGIHRLKKIRTIVTIHDVIFMRYPEFFSWIDQKVYEKKLRYACKVSDLINTVSTQSAEDISHFFSVPKEKIKVSYESCDESFYRPIHQDTIKKTKGYYRLRAPYLLHVGTFEPRKNQMLLLKIFASLPSNYPIHLTLVGKATGKREIEYRKQLCEFTAQHRLQDRVHILEYVPFEHMPALYQGASLFLYPSLFEGLGIPLLEAQFSGVPILTINRSCFPEVAGKHSSYVESFDVSEWKVALLKLMDDENLRKKMSQDGRLYVQHFHAKEVTKNLYEQYMHILR